MRVSSFAAVPTFFSHNFSNWPPPHCPKLQQQQQSYSGGGVVPFVVRHATRLSLPKAAKSFQASQQHAESEKRGPNSRSFVVHRDSLSSLFPSPLQVCLLDPRAAHPHHHYPKVDRDRAAAAAAAVFGAAAAAAAAVAVGGDVVVVVEAAVAAAIEASSSPISSPGSAATAAAAARAPPLLHWV